MKCRWTEKSTNTPIEAASSRVGVISLSFSLMAEPTILSFSICCQQDMGGNRYWLTVWTRKDEFCQPRMNPRLDIICPTLSMLDYKFVESTAQYLQREYDGLIEGIVQHYEDTTSEREIRSLERLVLLAPWEVLPWCGDEE